MDMIWLVSAVSVIALIFVIAAIMASVHAQSLTDEERKKIGHGPKGQGR